MADNPYAQYTANPYRPVYGSPRQPSPQTPAQATGDQLGVVRQQQQIEQVPLQNENTRVNIEQGRTSIASTQNHIKNTNLDNVNNLRKQFETEQSVQDYKTVLPLMDNAFKLGPNKAGDLNLVYAFGKAMDPNSVVREGEQVMATNVGGISEKVKGYIAQIEGGGGLTPIQRTQLTEELRNRARSLQQTYNQRRAFYEDFAQRSGINPGDVTGPHPGAPFIADEKSYIEQHGGTPKVEGVPVVAGQTQAGFDLKQDPRNTELSPEQAKAYDAFWGANPNPSPEQLVGFVQSMGVPGAMPIEQAKAIIDAKKAGRGISHDVQIKPDISDVRGGGGAAEKLDAGIRGAADTASFGLMDKVAAVGDTLTNGGSTLDQNLARQYAISDYDTQNHFPSRLIGQAVGGLAIPFGEATSIPQVALKSGAIGAGYGVGSSRSAGDVPANALLGFAGGAAAGGTVAGIGRGINALRGGAKNVPPLVDQATGELNAPMDVMRPADRVQTMRDYGMNTITPGAAGGRTARVLEQGFNNLPASAGHMEDINSAASGELRRAMQGVAQKFGTSKTMNEGGAAVQSAALARNDRAETVISKAYNAIPISDAAPAAKTSTIATLQQLTGRFQNNQKLADAMHDPRLAAYLDAFQNGDVSWSDIKQFRTIIGEKIGDMRFGEKSSVSDLRALYGALSEDMRATASQQGPRALRTFERANSLHRENEKLIQNSLTRILGKDGQMKPEQAAAAIRAMTQGGKAGGDLGTLAQVRSATIKSGAWDEIASTMIHLGGQPANSEGRAFQPATFVNWYADMSEPARRMLFKPELRSSLDGFVAMTQQLARLKGLNNTSQTAPVMFGGGALLSGAAALLNPILGLKVAGVLAINYGMGKAWTSPAFVRLVTGYGRAAASGNQNAVKSQVGRLSKLAATNPELRAPIENLLKNIANDNAMLGAAASDSNTEEK